MEQIVYLEKLLDGYKKRYAKGEKDLADRIRVTAAQLDTLKIKQFYEDQKKTPPPAQKSVLHYRPRSCCRGR